MLFFRQLNWRMSMAYKDIEKRREAARNRYHRIKQGGGNPRGSHPKECLFCKKEFVATRKSTKFCGKDCAHRHKSMTMAGKPPLHGKPNPKNKGWTTSNGYKYLYLPGHPMASKQGYVAEHRMVMSEMIGRPLHRGEHVHHKNRDRMDNRPENLELVSAAEHMATHWAPLSVTCPCCGHVLVVGED